MQKQKTTNIIEDDLGHMMRSTLGAIVVAMVTSLSAHHVHPTSTGVKAVTVAEVSHISEHQREVLHGQLNLGRARFTAVTGN